MKSPFTFSIPCLNEQHHQVASPAPSWCPSNHSIPPSPWSPTSSRQVLCIPPP